MSDLMVAVRKKFELSGNALRPVAPFDLRDAEDALEQLANREGETKWYIGDLWLLMRDHFSEDYGRRLDILKDRFPHADEYARVARAFPARVDTGPLRSSTWRIEKLSFGHHRVCAAIGDEQERMAWLEDALRHGWSVKRLTEALAEVNTRRLKQGQPALTVRANDELRTLILGAAEDCAAEPVEWAEQGLRWLAENGSPHWTSALVAA